MGNEMIGSIRATQARLEADAGSMAQSAPAAGAPPDAADGVDAVGFADRLREAVLSVDAQDRIAAAKMADVDAGRSDDLVGAMLSSQQASLSFSMLMQTRNKVVGALDELIKLQL